MRRSIGQLSLDRARRGVAVQQLLERSVIDERAFVEHQHALTELLNVREVVGGEDDRGLVLLADGADEFADRVLALDVKANRGLVQVDDAGTVQERRRQLAAHALAETQGPHRLPHQLIEPQQIGQLPQPRLVVRLAQAVDLAQQRKGIDGRQVPQQVRPLAEQHANVARVVDAALEGVEPQDPGVAGRRVEHAGQYLDRRRFTRAVGPEQSDDLALGHVERHVVDAADLAVLRRDERSQPPEASGPAPLDAISLGQALCLDCRDGNLASDCGGWIPGRRCCSTLFPAYSPPRWT